MNDLSKVGWKRNTVFHYYALFRYVFCPYASYNGIGLITFFASLSYYAGVIILRW